MSYLILGGTGTVGSRIVRQLLQRGERVRVVTRSEERARTLPAGVEGVVGDLTEPSTYERMFAAAEVVFLLNQVTLSELHEGLAALNEAKRAGARRIVYLSVQGSDRGKHIPHFGAKLAIEEALRESGVEFTILQPNNFYQNDFWFKTPLLEYGVYAQPIGLVGCSRVDVDDVADAAVNALTGSGHEGRTYVLAGPDPLTGEDCARLYGEALGREVRYAGDDLEAWGRAARQAMPDFMVWDYQIMFHMFQTEGFLASSSELAEQERVVGHPPRRYVDYVRANAAAWAAEAPPAATSPSGG